MKKIFLIVLLCSCSTLQKNDDGTVTEKPTFFGKTMHFVGDILGGMGNGLQSASQNQQTYRTVDLQTGQYRNCNQNGSSIYCY